MLIGLTWRVEIAIQQADDVIGCGCDVRERRNHEDRR